MVRKSMYVRWKVLFCVMLFVMMTSAVALAELPENAPGTGASGSDEINIITINPADIRLNGEEFLNPGIFLITKKEYEKNYQNMLENRGFGGVILDAGARAIAESGMTDKAKELADKYDPAKPGAGNLLDQTNGIEDTLVGSWFDPSVDSTGNLIASLTDSLNPTSAKGKGGTIISTSDDSAPGIPDIDDPNDKSHGEITCVSDFVPIDEGTTDHCIAVDYDRNGNEIPDASNDVFYTYISLKWNEQNKKLDENDAAETMGEVAETKGETAKQEGKKTQAPADDGSGTGTGDPNTAGYSISGVVIEQSDHEGDINDGGASSKINKKYNWLIEASKQPGFFNPSGGGYEPGDTGLGGDVGIVTYDRTRLPNVNTEKKIPWYLQPVAQPKDLGYASEMAETAGESRAYEFSGENMMASPEALGGLKAGDTVKNNVAGGGAVRP